MKSKVSRGIVVANPLPLPPIAPREAPREARPAGTPSGVPAAAFPPEAMQLLQSGPPMYIASLTGHITYANQQYCRLQQMTAEKRAGFFATANVPAFPIVEIIRDINASGCTIQREDVVESAEGTAFYSSQHYPIRDQHGGIVAVGGVYQNASREALAWLETLAARDRFRDVARLVADWIWETDTSFNFTYVSPRVIDVLNMHPRLLQGTSLFALGRFRDPDPGLSAAAAQDLETGGAAKPAPLPDRSTRAPFRDVLFEVPNKDGEIRLLLVSGLPLFADKTGAFEGFRGTARDITAEMAVRRAAEQGQRRLADAIENISDGFILRDLHAQLCLCNSKAHDFLAPIVEALVLKTPFPRILAVAKEAGLVTAPADALDRWADQAGPGRRLTAPLELRLADGRWIKIVESRTTRGGVITLLSDISEVKRREEALISARHAAERASRSKGDFLANMSHELRTPLNAIIGFSEIMMGETFGPLGSARYLDYIKDIHDSSRHLLGVINDILDISKSEAGKVHLHEEDVDLLDEIRGAVRLFSEQSAESRITLALELPPSMPLVWADSRKIKQVLLNLISNAIKFTPPGGTVTIEAGQDAGSGDVLLSVTDTGIGIDNADMEKVLMPFGQVESAMSRRHDGTGLGLPLSLALIEIHDGRLTLNSTPGVGTTVTVRLPASRVRQISAA